jgi:hypothetical protein
VTTVDMRRLCERHCTSPRAVDGSGCPLPPYAEARYLVIRYPDGHVLVNVACPSPNTGDLVADAAAVAAVQRSAEAEARAIWSPGERTELRCFWVHQGAVPDPYWNGAMALRGTVTGPWPQ